MTRGRHAKGARYSLDQTVYAIRHALGSDFILSSGRELRLNQQYAVAPDDRRFLMVRPLESGSPDNITVVENWFEELKAKSRK